MKSDKFKFSSIDLRTLLEQMGVSRKLKIKIELIIFDKTLSYPNVNG